jgi:hypothetical protein
MMVVVQAMRPFSAYAFPNDDPSGITQGSRPSGRAIGSSNL